MLEPFSGSVKTSGYDGGMAGAGLRRVVGRELWVNTKGAQISFRYSPDAVYLAK